MEEVRASSAWVASHSSHVTVDSEGIEKVVESVEKTIPKVEWNYEGIHYFDNGHLTVQYLFVLDALNFCFWPDQELNYDDLASGLKAALENDQSVFKLIQNLGLTISIYLIVLGQLMRHE